MIYTCHGLRQVNESSIVSCADELSQVDVAVTDSAKTNADWLRMLVR